jgi:HAD superfamily hydrolase (TIGR01509 family)
MIKLIIFDLDGVIADLKLTHYDALNSALELIDTKYVISKNEHTLIYDGLSTKKKLNLLVETKQFPINSIDTVFALKQKYTIDIINKSLFTNIRLIEILTTFKNEGYKLYIGSNAIRETIITSLHRLGILHLFDKIFSNEDVLNQKPNAEIYLRCMLDAKVQPYETIIIEDSKHGLQAAVNSGAYVCSVDNSQDISYNKIKKIIDTANKKSEIMAWPGKNINILMPMAGLGSRFTAAGYKLPKPLIDVNGKPMLQTVVENLNIDGNFIFIVQKEHYEQYNLNILLSLIAKDCKIIQVNGITEGAACTALLAKEFINNDMHLIISNSDQFIEWNSNDFIYNSISNDLDGNILTFATTGNKWSYAKTNEFGFVEEVAEKKEISNSATCGIYYFKHGSDFVNAAENMISKNIKTNNEYYICPTYNELIATGKKIKTMNCDKMWGLGTPEDLEFFLNTYKG